MRLVKTGTGGAGSHNVITNVSASFVAYISGASQNTHYNCRVSTKRLRYIRCIGLTNCNQFSSSLNSLLALFQLLVVSEYFATWKYCN